MKAVLCHTALGQLRVPQIQLGVPTLTTFFLKDQIYSIIEYIL